jgi:hypothetical protein
MQMANNSFKALMMPVCLLVSATLVVKGVDAYSILSKNTKAQMEATDKLQQWSTTFRALAVSMEQWQKNYRAIPTENTITDALAIAAFEKYGVETDVDNVLINAVDTIQSGGVDIGMNRVCLTTGVEGGTTLFLRSTSYEGLLNGLTALSKRPDVEIGAVSLFGNGPFPVAKITGFCLLARHVGAA